MKKYFSLGIIVLLLFSLTACVGDKERGALVQFYVNREEYDKAISLIHRFRAKDSKNESLYKKEKAIYEKLGQEEESIGVLEEAIENLEDSLNYKKELLDKYIDKGDYSKAESLALEILEEDKEDQNTYLDLFKIYRNRGEHERILRVFDQYEDHIEGEDLKLRYALSYNEVYGEDGLLEIVNVPDISVVKSNVDIVLDYYIHHGEYHMARELVDLIEEKWSDKPIFLEAYTMALEETGDSLRDIYIGSFTDKTNFEAVMVLRNEENQEILINDIETGREIYRETIDNTEDLRLMTGDFFKDGVFEILASQSSKVESAYNKLIELVDKDGKLSIESKDLDGFDLKFFFYDNFKATLMSHEAKVYYKLLLSDQHRDELINKGFYKSSGAFIPQKDYYDYRYVIDMVDGDYKLLYKAKVDDFLDGERYLDIVGVIDYKKGEYEDFIFQLRENNKYKDRIDKVTELDVPTIR